MIIGWFFPCVWHALFTLMFEMPPSETSAYAEYVAGSGTALPSAVDEKGIGSMYGTPDDRWLGSGKMACAPHDPVPQDENTCAHRYYPCGTILIIEYPKSGKRTWCEVTDRGPYGANVFAADTDEKVMINGKAAWYIKIRKDDPPPDHLCPSGDCYGKWRGVIDMAPGTARALGHPGWGYVRVWRLQRVIKYQEYLEKKKSRTSS